MKMPDHLERKIKFLLLLQSSTYILFAIIQVSSSDGVSNGVYSCCRVTQVTNNLITMIIIIIK